ncbi:MAG TPA: hypothetical protein VJA21_09785 [Verrucomicrobiae bacterium]
MKTLLTVCFCFAALFTQAQTVSQSAPASARAPLAVELVERGPHHKLWARSTPVTNTLGLVHFRTNCYTELHGGISYRSPETGQWEQSSPDFTVTPQGYAIASKCQHRLIVAPDANDPEGVVDCLMPDGRRTRSTLVGLSLFSPVTGKSLQIATVKSCAGEQTAPNEITFPDVFEGMLKASLRIRNERHGYHQDLLLNERFSAAQLERLASLGFDSSMRIEVWTEFIEPATPVVQDVLVRVEPNAASFAEPNTLDAAIDFGAMRFGAGRSFVEGAEGERTAPIFKQWLPAQSRAFLIEGAAGQDLLPLMEWLPASTMTVRNLPARTSGLLAGRVPPQKRVASAANSGRPLENVLNRSPKPIRIAQLDPTKPRSTQPRLVLDYSLLNGTLTNVTCRAGETVFVSGPVTITDSLVLEGTSVVKLTNSPTALITAYNIVCETGPYRMAALTSWCDDSLGDVISGSTGNPTNYNGGTYLREALFQHTNAYKYLRFLYAGAALQMKPRDGVWHCQFVNCKKAITFGLGGSLWLHNVLFSGCDQAIYGSGYQIYGEHLTVDGPYFNRYSCTVRATNSIFVGALSAGDAAFDHCATNSSAEGVFQTVGAGKYYLVPGSTNRCAGTTNINPTLLAELRRKTTSPPVVSCGVTVSSDLTLYPLAQRVDSTPDLGFCYDPIDYAMGHLMLTNATLTINPGTVVATFGTNSWNHGIGITTDAQILCEGSPANLNRFVVYNTVQEQSASPWRQAAPGGSVDEIQPTSRTIRFRFTDWSAMAQAAAHLTSGNIVPFHIRDCQFHGGSLTLYGAALHVTNSLFEGVSMDFEPAEMAPSFLVNNLFRGGTFAAYSLVTNSLVRDNLFDQAAIPDWFGGYAPGYLGGYNAYVAEFDRLQPTNNTDIVLASSPAYQAGPLGNYYQLASSALINADTGLTADLVGLYHYTVCTNLVGGFQIKETNSFVDVGLHQVAVDANGVPIDSDGDGICDALEDRDGDALFDPGETDWQHSENGTTGCPGLQVFTPLK